MALTNGNPNLTHVGIFVTDIDSVATFYCDVLGLQITDRGFGSIFKNEICFMSGNPEEHHHQLVLSTGRDPKAASTVFQISFLVRNLDTMRSVDHKLRSLGINEILYLNHGNAWSIYFDDPEANKVEVYMPTGLDVPQPCAEHWNIETPLEELMEETRKLAEDRARR